ALASVGAVAGGVPLAPPLAAVAGAAVAHASADAGAAAATGVPVGRFSVLIRAKGGDLVATVSLEDAGGTVGAPRAVPMRAWRGCGATVGRAVDIVAPKLPPPRMPLEQETAAAPAPAPAVARQPAPPEPPSPLEFPPEDPPPARPPGPAPASSLHPRWE